MPRRIEKHPNVVLGLVLGLLRTKFKRVSDRGPKVAYLEVEVHHHLLRTFSRRPDRTHELG